VVEGDSERGSPGEASPLPESRAARVRDGFTLLTLAVLALVGMVLVVHAAMRAFGVDVEPGAESTMPPEVVQQALLAQGVGNLAVIGLWLLAPAVRTFGSVRWAALAPAVYVGFLLVVWVPSTMLYSVLLQELGTERSSCSAVGCRAACACCSVCGRRCWSLRCCSARCTACC
jgi:hypothetical protein